MHPIDTLALTTIDGRTRPLKDFMGKATLVVNVASKCGFTPQYKGLEALYREFKAQGLQVLGFPCDQFRHQEPGNEADIQNFCSLTYDVTFPMFAKIDVNGPRTHPLYQHLKKAAPGIFGSERVKWNFTKFLLNDQGKVLARYAPTTRPESLKQDVAAALARAAAQQT